MSGTLTSGTLISDFLDSGNFSVFCTGSEEGVGLVSAGAALIFSVSSLGQLLISTLLTVVLMSASILLRSMPGALPVADLGID